MADNVTEENIPMKGDGVDPEDPDATEETDFGGTDQDLGFGLGQDEHYHDDGGVWDRMTVPEWRGMEERMGKLRTADALANKKNLYRVIKKLYRAAVKTHKMTYDLIRIRNGLKPEFTDGIEVVKEAVEDSDWLRLRHFGRWAKKNVVGISGGLISAAGLITGIIMAARSALRTGASAVGKFSKAVAKVFGKLGPVFSAIGSLVGTVLSWGAKGISWMASNLWFFAVMALAALYAEYGRRRRS